MVNLSKPFIKRPVMTFLVTLGICIFGILAYLQLPIRNLPEVTYPFIEVTTYFPGASAQTMANNVASPLEDQLLATRGLKAMNSINRQGFSKISLEFHLDKNISEAETDVQTAISQAMGNLPSELPSPPSYSRNNPNNSPVLYLALSTNDYSEGELYNFANTHIARQISLLEGVSTTGLFGAPEALRVLVDLEQLYHRSVTVSDVKNAISANNVLISSGRLEGAYAALTISPSGQLFEVEEFENIVIAYPKDGGPIYLKDVARVLKGNSLESYHLTNFNVHQSEYKNHLILAVMKTQNANVLEVSKRVKEKIEELKEVLPKNIHLFIAYDNAASVGDSINEIKMNLLIAFILIILVTFIFFGRARNTLIPTIALPLSLLITFICMKLLGFSLDNLSLLSIIVVMGFLVDDAIVLLENTVRHIEKGEDPVRATIKSAKEISITILTITISLATLFIPVLFLSGEIGRIFQEFSLTLIIAVLASGLVSIFITPTLCTHILKSSNEEKPLRVMGFFPPILKRVTDFYLKVLDAFLIRKWIVYTIWIACVAGTLFLASALPKNFLPAGDSSLIQGFFLVNEGTSYEQMHEYQFEIQKQLEGLPDIKALFTFTGLPMYMGSNMGMFSVVLVQPQERKHFKNITLASQEVESRLASVAGILAMAHPQPLLEISTGITSTLQGNYAYTLSGVDTQNVYASAQAIMSRLRKDKNFTNVSTDIYMNNPEVKLEILREKAAKLGVTPEDIERALFDAYSKNYSSLILDPTKRIEVIVQADRQYAQRPSNFNYIFIPSRSHLGTMVPLSEVTKASVVPGPLSVAHANGMVSQTIFFDLKKGVALSSAVSKLEGLKKGLVSPGTLAKLEGKADVFISAFKDFEVLILVMLLLIYILLGSLYQSYFYPIVILATFPTALIGAFFSLYVCGVSFTLYGFLGCFLLLGLIQKNGILIVDFALENQKKLKMTPEDAVLSACKERFRPILMTTAAAFMGALPVALSFGAQGSLHKSLGIPIVGGLIVSQLVTLFVVPVFYLAMNKFHERFVAKK